MPGLDERALVVLTSTFPRWPGDATPSFVADFARRVADAFRDVCVIAPHARGAATHERVGPVEVRRFRYAPVDHEDIAYEGGAVAKMRPTPGYAAKLAGFLGALTVTTLVQAVRRRGAVLNAHWLIPQGFIALVVGRLTGRPVVVTVHGGDVFALNSPLFTRAKRVVLRRADAVVVNSSATRAACQRIHADREYRVIPMGVDLAGRFTARGRDEALARELDVDGFTALFVGRLSEEKGARYLVDAVDRLAQRGEPVRLLVVGDGPQRAELERVVADRGLADHVRLLGWKDQEDLPALYALADVFVGPSVRHRTGWQEAFGLVFVEALAMGTPVITTATGGIADIVHDGENGYLVPERDADAIADTLARLARDPQLTARLAARARDSVAAFSWESCVAAYREVFARLER